MSFVDLVSADVEQVIGRFEGFHLRFASHFATLIRPQFFSSAVVKGSEVE